MYKISNIIVKDTGDGCMGTFFLFFLLLLSSSFLFEDPEIPKHIFDASFRNSNIRNLHTVQTSIVFM
jgi:hypothetical protein